MRNLMDDITRMIVRLNGSRIMDPAAQRAVLKVFGRQTTVNAAMTLVTAGVALVFLIEEVPLTLLLPWWACLSGLSGYYLSKYLIRRLGPQRPKNERSDRQVEDLGFVVAKACMIAGLSGVLWGAGVFFLPYVPIDKMPFIVIVAGAMAGGAATTLAALPVAANTFILSSILPYAVHFIFFSRDEPNLALGFLALIMTGGLLWSTKLVHGSVLKEIELRDKNQSLVDDFLSERHELLDTVFGADAYAVFDTSSELQLWNAKLAQTFGFAETQLKVGMSRREVLSLFMAPMGTHCDGALFTSWVNEQMTLEFWHEDGENAVTLENGTTVKTTARRTVGGSTVMVFSDITFERIQQSALESSQRRFQDLAKIAQDDLVAVSGENYLITQWVGREGIEHGHIWQKSPVGESLLAYSKNWKLVNDLGSTLQELLSDRLPFRHIEFSIATDDGERWKQISGEPTVEIGNMPGYLLAISDVTDAHVARKRQDEYSQRMAALTEVSSEVIWDIAPDGTIRGLFGGGNRVRHSGYVTGRKFSEVWNYERQEIEADQDLVELVRNQEIVRDLDYRVRPVGEPTWEYRRAIGAPTYDLNGEYLGYLIATHDVNSIKRLEAEQQQRADEIKLLTENLSAGVFRIRHEEGDWSLDYINAWLTSEYGIEEDAIERLIAGKGPKDIVGRGYAKRNKEIERARAAKGNYEIRWALNLPGSPRRWILERGRLSQSEDGFDVIDGIMSDVTAAVQSEQELVRGRKRLSDMLAVLDVTNDAVAIQDKNGSVIYTNRTARRLRNDARSSSTFGDFVSLLPLTEAEEPEVRLELESALETSGQWVKTIPSAADGGEIRLLDVSVTSIPDGGAFLFAADTTTRKKMEIEEQKLRAELAEAQHMQDVGHMAGGIAHDFANIVASVRSFADLLVDDLEVSSNEGRYAAKISAACDRASEVVQQILAFARSARFEREPVYAAEAWGDTQAVLEGLLSQEQIEAEFNMQVDREVVECGQAGFVQILMNLAVNARDALPDGVGSVRSLLSRRSWSSEAVELFSNTEAPGASLGEEEYLYRVIDGALESDQDYVCICVEDNGGGMSQDMLTRILDPFFTTKAKATGNGLGLSVVRNVIARCKGALIVESTPGSGSRFSALLPVSDLQVPKMETTAKPKTLPSVESQRGARILIVDDEEDLSDVLSMALTKAGHETTNTYSALEAWEVFQDDPDHWDIIVTDQVMPKMHGTELISKVRKVRADIPIILCTAFSETLTQKSALDMGASVFMSKPVLLNDIIKTVESFELS